METPKNFESLDGEEQRVVKLLEILTREAADLAEIIEAGGITEISVTNYSPIQNNVSDQVRQLFTEIEETKSKPITDVSRKQELAESANQPVNKIKNIDFTINYDRTTSSITVTSARIVFNNESSQTFKCEDGANGNKTYLMQTLDSAGMPLVLPPPRRTDIQISYSELLTKLKEAGLHLPDQNTAFSEQDLDGILQFAKNWQKKTEKVTPLGPELPQLYVRDLVVGGVADTVADFDDLVTYTAESAWHRTVVVGLELGDPESLVTDTSLQVTLASNSPDELVDFHDFTRVPISYKPLLELRPFGVRGKGRVEIEAFREPVILTEEIITSFRTAVLMTRGDIDPVTELKRTI